MSNFLRFDYPYSSTLNPRLYKIIKENLIDTGKGGAHLTDYFLHKKNIKDVDVLMEWIKNLIPQVAYDIAKGDEYNGVGFDINAFTIQESWGIHYNKGESVIKHNHFPYILAFCYYVNTPKGSSPTILGGKRINPPAGQLIFFQGHIYHEVLKSKVDGRCVIAGLILYEPNK